ncbi:hypothetical protein Mal15_54940 [Stieleria maiorica]|uniref:Uncharacterized protein n=1 Tax=Stieleria maiorica TaxID=2795974 RepID=A0A5B9MQW4_9BACT|nr:hypothetical protein Mal15_54940 [Stieleria maiorica]
MPHSCSLVLHQVVTDAHRYKNENASGNQGQAADGFWKQWSHWGQVPSLQFQSMNGLWSPRRRDGPELKNKLDSPTAVHHLVHADRPRRQLEPSSLMANVLDRNGQGKSSVPICGQHFGCRLSALQSSGVGLSSSAESTAHRSNDDVRSESQEIEV